MKTLLLALSLTLFSGAAFAAKTSGSYIAQGRHNFSGSTEIGNRGSSYFNLTLNEEYFFTDELAVGGMFSYSSLGSTNQFLLGPSASYYFLQQDNMAFFFHGDLAFADTNNTDGTLSMGLGVGLSYFLNNYVAVKPMVQFRHYFEDQGYDDDFGLNAALSIYF